MTPRRLDPALIQERLREIQLLLGDLAAALRPSAGMRNVLVHDYLEVDHGKVAEAIPLALQQYRQYVRHVARWLRDRATDPS